MRKIEFVVPIISTDDVELEEYQEDDFEKEFRDSFFCDYNDEYSSISLKVSGEILSLYSSEGGAPEIHFLEVDSFSIDLTDYTGSFYLQYEIHRTFGCSDLDSQESDYLEFNFEIADGKFCCESTNTITAFTPE